MWDPPPPPASDCPASQAVAAEAKPEGSKFALVRGALQVFQGAVAERGRGVGVDDSDTFAALIHEYLAPADASRGGCLRTLGVHRASSLIQHKFHFVLSICA